MMPRCRVAGRGVEGEGAGTSGRSGLAGRGWLVEVALDVTSEASTESNRSVDTAEDER